MGLEQLDGMGQTETPRICLCPSETTSDLSVFKIYGVLNVLALTVLANFVSFEKSGPHWLREDSWCECHSEAKAAAKATDAGFKFLSLKHDGGLFGLCWIVGYL